MALTVREMTRKYGNEYLATIGNYKYFPTMNANSHVFFANGTSTIGNDLAANQGQTPDTPLLTIAKALSLCTDGANDYVFILDYPATAPATEVFPLVMDKQRVHVIGVLNGMIPRFKIVAPGDTTDSEVFEFTNSAANGTYGSYCEIANLLMGNQKAATTYGAIEFHYSGIWGTHIHHCGFGLNGRSNTDAKYGIVFGRTLEADQAGECIYGLIEHCSFGELIVADGIYVPATTYSGPNAMYGTIIRNNRFKVAGKGIYTLKAGDWHEAAILDNIFSVSGVAGGEAVDIVAGTTGLYLDGNHALLADDSAAITNTDEVFEGGASNGDGFGWGLNYVGATLLDGEAHYTRA